MGRGNHRTIPKGIPRSQRVSIRAGWYYLVGLVEKGELPVRKVGNQRRLPLADVLEYKARTRANRLEALREMTALDQELGLR